MNRKELPQPNRDLLIKMGYDGFTYFDEYDGAIVGMTIDNRVVYDYYKMADCLMQDDGMDEESAFDWINYNTIRALPYIPNHPYILWQMDELPYEIEHEAAIGTDSDDRVVFDLDKMMELNSCDQENAIKKIMEFPQEGDPIIIHLLKREEATSN